LVRKQSAWLVWFALCLVLTTGSIQTVGQSAPSYLTTSMVPRGVGQHTLSGYQGVMVNYTNYLNQTVWTNTLNQTVLIYLDLSNHLGQVVSLSLATCYPGQGENDSCFVAFSPTLAPGNYSATIFAATTSNIPLSVAQNFSIRV